MTSAPIMQVEEPRVERAQALVVPEPIAASSVLSARQLEVLTAIVDGIVRRCSEQEVKEILAALPQEADEEQRRAAEIYARKAYSDYPGALDYLADQCFVSFSEPNLVQFKLILTLLGTRLGCFALTGKLGPFDQLSDIEREQCFLKLKSSPVADLRKLAKTFLSLPHWCLYMNQAEACVATGYPFYGDPNKKRDIQRAHPSYKFNFETIAAEGQVIDTGVLVIGTGCGGGVVAHTLAQAGEELLIVDKGQYIPTESITGGNRDGFHSMYEAKGAIVAEAGGIVILAASTWGGGSVINWSASLRPPAHLREAWEKQYNLPYFNSQDYDDDVEYVCGRMKVSSDRLQHSYANERIIAGARRLGIRSSVIPQNTGGHVHCCGFCGNGCPYGEKQGSTVSWLCDAAERGAHFMQRTRIERILFGPALGASIDVADPKAHWPDAVNHVAIGALIIGPDGKQAVVRARKGVILSGGSVNTPPTLLRSGLKNPNIGQNLHLHPCAFITATFADDVRPWEGAIMTALSDGSEDRDGQHFGSRLEALASGAATAGGIAVWRGSVDHKKRMLNYRKTASFIILTRDRDGGRVSINKEGNPIIDYIPSAYDRQSMTAGLVNGCRILLASGATSLNTCQPFVEVYTPTSGDRGVDEPAFLAWLKKVADTGVLAMGASLGSAHQMGSCRMGDRPSRSVVDPRGRVWGTKGLWIADASVFPTASGVNPMITTMSTARSIAKFALEDMNRTESVQAHL